VFRLVIAGGGTGGHLYPGIAVAREVIAGSGEVLFIGAENGIEARVLPREGFALKTIRAGKFKGMGMANKIRTLGMIPSGVLASMDAIKGFGPQAVLGVGGYASFSALIAAKLLGLPVVIQEQNAIPGLTNRVLGKFADRVALGFSDAEGYFPKGRSTYTGNPVRAELSKADRATSFKAFGLDVGRTTVLVFGGSGGAHTINKGVTDALPLIGGLRTSVQFIHQTGERDLQMVQDAYDKSGVKAGVLPFIYDMAGAYACADLVVCRSGALTIAELAALGKPAVLVPYPHAANNHQAANARVMERAGAARLLMDSDADGRRFASEVTALILDKATLSEMSGRSLALGRPDAAKRVLEICMVAGGGKPGV